MSIRRTGVALVAFGSLTLGSCTEPPVDPSADEPAAARTSAFTVLASEPVTLAGAPRASYVWIPAGTLDSGTTVRLRNTATGTTRSATIDPTGGLDPVPLPAAVDDEIEVTALGGAPGTTVAYAIVPARRRPKVVRTDPARGKTDVPVNASIVIVVSEPLDSASVNPTTIRLITGQTAVPGVVRVGAAPEYAEFIPVSPLEPGTAYELFISGLRDRQGDALDAPVTTTFRTVNPPGPGVSFLSVTAGGNHTCGLASDSTVWCWGSNAVAQLGADADSGATIPVRASDLRFRRVTAGSGVTCAEAPVVHCWGMIMTAFETAGVRRAVLVRYGEPTTVFGTTPSTLFMALPGNPTDLHHEGGHICRATSEGIQCQGLWEQEGSDALSVWWVSYPWSSPIPVPEFVDYSAGGSHDCLVALDGRALCFGWNRYRQLGGDTANIGPVDNRLVEVEGVPPFVAVAAGGLHTCALTAEGAAWCWGNGRSPAAVPGGLSFRSITAGAHHTCGITTDGDAYCWGEPRNRWGQLGDGTLMTSATPVLVYGGIKWVQLSAGAHHTCGIGTLGYAYCWGKNSDGQLGDGGRVSRLVPTWVANQQKSP